MHVFSTQKEILDVKHEFVTNSIPIYLFGRMERSLFYIDFGLGLDAWFFNGNLDGEKFEATSYTGVGLSAYASPGIRYEVSKQIDLRGGLSFFFLESEAERKKFQIAHLGLMLGVSYTF